MSHMPNTFRARNTEGTRLIGNPPNTIFGTVGPNDMISWLDCPKSCQSVLRSVYPKVGSVSQNVHITSNNEESTLESQWNHASVDVNRSE